LRKNKRAVTPAISTIIITAALVVLVLVTVSFADNELTIQMAQGEFSSSKNFMQSTGTQIDNVAWTIGRTEAVDYIAKYGDVSFTPGVLNYTFEVSYNDGASWQLIYNCTTGMIMYNMPASVYSIGNDCFSRIVPASSGSFLQQGVSAPVYQVFEVENAVAYGAYARIVTVPTVRVINSTLPGESSSESYYEFYVPSLVTASSPYLSQSLSLTGAGLNMAAASNSAQSSYQVRITATIPMGVIPSGFKSFSNSFFNFDHTTETLSVPAGSFVEIYNGNVRVSIGLT